MDPPARFAVLDRCPGVAVRFQPRPGGFLELVQHAADLRIARFVLRCPGDDARRVLPAPIQQAPTRNLLAYKFARFWALPLKMRSDRKLNAFQRPPGEIVGAILALTVGRWIAGLFVLAAAMKPFRT